MVIHSLDYVPSICASSLSFVPVIEDGGQGFIIWTPGKTSPVARGGPCVVIEYRDDEVIK